MEATLASITAVFQEIVLMSMMTDSELDRQGKAKMVAATMEKLEASEAQLGPVKSLMHKAILKQVYEVMDVSLIITVMSSASVACTLPASAILAARCLINRV